MRQNVAEVVVVGGGENMFALFRSVMITTKVTMKPMRRIAQWDLCV